ncbi:transmembrane protein C1orf162 homolog [Acomys russatus]|uniref:transmembrane protein C1orf162 homolog n=1 Tax=Acomys russatus TaxID=60746 RepID=UPI0021E22E02|nr:transmembrane protein C1orf162 homolog [Acomys russatus]
MGSGSAWGVILEGWQEVRDTDPTSKLIPSMFPAGKTSTEAPVTSSAPISFGTKGFKTPPASGSSPPFLCKNSKEHLILAFFAGVLLTLLLVACIFIIIKSCRKCNSRAHTQDPHSEPPTKLSSISKESLTYASMTFKSSNESSSDLTKNHPTALDPTVYSQIKVADP